MNTNLCAFFAKDKEKFLRVAFFQNARAVVLAVNLCRQLSTSAGVS